MFDNLPYSLGEDVQERHDLGSFSDGTTMAYTYYMNRFEGKITGSEILALLESLEHANKVFVDVQKKICEAEGVDYANYGNENFCTLLLFHSDDNEILYAESAGVDEYGIKNGEIVLHCKKF